MPGSLDNLEEAIRKLQDMYDDPDIVIPASQLPEKENPYKAFEERNPMAGGGMLVQPGFGGTRQGYATPKGTPPDEFQTTESIPVARADGPDDYAIEIDEGGGESISDLVSDVSKLKEYATGQKPTLKEIVQTKKRKDKTRAISEGDREAETDFVINRQGEPIIDMEPDIDDAFASGGIARMLGE